MNKGYKIYGMCLNGEAIIIERLKILEVNEVREDYLQDKLLFDYGTTYYRTIKLSTIFSTNTNEELQQIIKHIKNLDILKIYIDIVPKYNKKVLIDFWKLRILQAISYIKKHASNVEIIIISDKEKNSIINTYF